MICDSESETTSLISKEHAKQKYHTTQHGQPGVTTKISGLSVRAPEPITYSWSNINVWVNAEKDTDTGNLDCKSLVRKCFKRKKFINKQILQNVSGVVKPGELLAIMGASGAGKTTLLNVLTFRNSGKLKVSGQRKINGVVVTPDMLTSVSAYVQQEDLFVPTLTVREHLVFQALVRMHKHIPYKQRMARVDEVIQELGLTKCADTRIGRPGIAKGISGGEMKRLSFASEVLTDCQLLFCDEPTSGLDSYMAMNVVGVLKQMASKGKTIVCTIHQPSSEVYALFDRLLLMAEGRVAYLGEAKDAVEFFQAQHFMCPPNFNPADFYIETLAIQPGLEADCLCNVKQICDAFDSSPMSKAISTEAQESPAQNSAFLEMQTSMRGRSPYKANWFAQFRAVLWRSWISLIREPMVIPVRFLQTVIIALLLGGIYWQQKLDQKGVMNINGALFLFLTNMTFQTVFGVINVFSEEVPVFLREHFNGMYRTDVYFLCKTLVEFPLYIIFPFIFVLISYWMIGFNNEDGTGSRFFMACLIAILVANVCCSFGYMISCISTSSTMAITIAPPFIVPFMLFGGFFLNNKSIPDFFLWLKYLSWFLYGNEALAINQWKGIKKIDCPPVGGACPANGDIVLSTMNFKEGNMTMDLCLLAALIVFYRGIAYVALLAKTCRKK